ncbi:hypothetical protein N7486_009811 [Penicillium sp. IBT 16267x]|nr:hypothetical protein N7486_009811 [Penicillium sp. IBT 16267x]
MASVCLGLVTIDDESKIIRLVHYTTQDYLERNCETWWPDAHTDITISSITYLSFKAFERGPSHTIDELKDKLQANNFYCYAAQNWGHHAKKSPIEGDKLVLNFLQDNAKISASRQAMIYDKSGGCFPIFERNIQTKAIHLAAYFGLQSSTSILLKKSSDVDSKDGDGRTSFSWAADHGHEAVVKLLLKKNADTESKDKGKQTPLLWAAKKGHKSVVKLLIKKNADIESKDKDGQTPLSWAAKKGHKAVVKLLIEKIADIESKDKDRKTPLTWAAKNGHDAVVKLLIEKDADIEVKDRYGKSPLVWATENRNKRVVKLLREKKGNIMKVSSTSKQKI